MEQCKHTAEKLMDNNNTDKLDSKLYIKKLRSHGMLKSISIFSDI